MKKKSFMFFLSICFMFLLCTGVSSAANSTGMTGSGNNGYGSVNGTTTTNSYGTNSTSNYRTNAATDDNDTNWGWLGLLGLVGLAGLKKRNREHT